MKKIFLSLIGLLIASSSMMAAETTAEFTYGNGQGKYVCGYGVKGHFDVAIKIQNPDFEGLQVSGLKAYDLNEYPDSITNYKIWWSAEEVPNDTPVPNAVDVEFDKSIWGLQTNFDNPPTIDKDGIWLGYSFDIPFDPNDNQSMVAYPIPYCDVTGTTNSLFIRFNDNSWEDYSDYFGPATIVAYLSGNIKTHALSVDKIVNRPFSQPGKSTIVQYRVTANGTQPITKVDYSYELNGQTITASKNLSLSQMGKSATLKVTYDALTEPGVYPINFTITKVNNMDNESASPSLITPLCLPAFSPVKRVLMEEVTATWCGWCMRGWLAMGLLKQKYPDTYIGAAYHKDDVMMVVHSAPKFNYGGGLPGCALDRGETSYDPFYGSDQEDNDLSVENDINKLLKNNGYADIAIETTWNEDKTQLNVKSATTFGAVGLGQMKVAYLLLQNDLSKPDNELFAQTNYYNGKSGVTGLLEELVNMPYTISDFTYEDVVINADYYLGKENSLPEVKDMKLSTPYEDQVTFNTDEIFGYNAENPADEYSADPDNNLATDPDEMEVVVMVLDANGSVLNSRKVKAGNSVASEVGIKDVVQNNDAAITPEYFDLQGRRVNEPQHGLFIKRQGNKATKVIL